MGTNYYYRSEICPCCNRCEERHIGKSSAGWCFGLHVYPQDGINDLADWQQLWEKPGIEIRNEYGDLVAKDEMLKIIADRKSWKGDEDTMPDRWYTENHAEPGPLGLARHTIEPRFCIGHGAGTWDLMDCEFS